MYKCKSQISSNCVSMTSYKMWADSLANCSTQSQYSQLDNVTANLQTIALCSVRLLPAQRSIFHIVKAEHEGGKKLTLNSTQGEGPRNAFLP